MQDWLGARVQATPRKIALIIGEQQWSYGELGQLVEKYCAGLLHAGVRPGEQVAVLLPNGLAYVGLIHALARLGLVLVPLNTRLTVAELGWQVTQSHCRLLIYGAATANVAAQLATERVSKTVDEAALQWAGERHTSGCQTQFRLDAPQAIVFTSGTTGQPKGAVLTFANHFWGANASAYRLGLLPQDRWLSCLPLYHVGGLAVVFRSCLYGTAIVLHERFALEAFNASLEADAITLTSLVPTMLTRLLAQRQDQPWPATLRHILLGGAAATPELLAASAASGAPVTTTYGLTEAASQVATLAPPDALRKPGSVGHPLMFTTVRIADETGASLPPGERGEVVVSGPTVMSGYYQNPVATAKTLRHGELFTGDIGFLDEEGDLWLVQRRSDLIISGGENVYPAEVEAVLRQHPAVADVCVVGLPDAEWGQRVAALVVCFPQAQVTVVELSAFSRQRLAGYKQPRLIAFTEALPQTASGKVERRAVVAQLADLQAQQPMLAEGR
ncbi:MAG: o-succinylbenzoate--CoA ligase [Caldilineaceae bacterium]|nr:o-succinylbenzoate--CoA ligase [Caldilineaceae bacterium]